MQTNLAELARLQDRDHDLLIEQTARRAQHRELSAQTTVIIAAMVSGGFRLIEVFVTQIVSLLSRAS